MFRPGHEPRNPYCTSGHFDRNAEPLLIKPGHTVARVTSARQPHRPAYSQYRYCNTSPSARHAAFTIVTFITCFQKKRFLIND
jgi:hypothetical protein